MVQPRGSELQKDRPHESDADDAKEDRRARRTKWYHVRSAVAELNSATASSWTCRSVGTRVTLSTTYSLALELLTCSLRLFGSRSGAR